MLLLLEILKLLRGGMYIVCDMERPFLHLLFQHLFEVELHQKQLIYQYVFLKIKNYHMCYNRCFNIKNT